MTPGTEPTVSFGRPPPSLTRTALRGKESGRPLQFGVPGSALSERGDGRFCGELSTLIRPNPHTFIGPILDRAGAHGAKLLI